jgi:hypothetical protein
MASGTFLHAAVVYVVSGEPYSATSTGISTPRRKAPPHRRMRCTRAATACFAHPSAAPSSPAARKNASLESDAPSAGAPPTTCHSRHCCGNPREDRQGDSHQRQRGRRERPKRARVGAFDEHHHHNQAEDHAKLRRDLGYCRALHQQQQELQRLGTRTTRSFLKPIPPCRSNLSLRPNIPGRREKPSPYC